MDDTARKEFLDVMQRVRRAKTYVSDWKSNIEKWRRLYDQIHYDRRARKGETQYNDPTYVNTVDLAVGIMRSNDFVWHAFGMHPSDKEQKDTANLEKLLDGAFSINAIRSEIDLKYALLFNFTRDGGGVIYSVFDPEIASRSKSLIQVVDESSPNGLRPIYSFGEVPIVIQIIDPYKFIGLPGGPYRWLAVGRVERISVLDVETLYHVQIQNYVGMTQEMKSIIKGEFIDIWDYVVQDDGSLAVRNTVIFDKDAIRGPQIMSGYKDLPYTVQFYKPSGDLSKDWNSLITPLESTVSQLEKSFNRRAMQVDMYTALPLVSKTQQGRVVQLDKDLFQHTQLFTDESLGFVSWPGNPPDVQLHMEFLRSRIQQSGFSDIMFGSGVGQIAGYALSQLGDQNRIRLTQPIKHMELMLTIWAKKTIRLLSEFAKDAAICVYGHHRGRNYYDQVEIKDFEGYTIRAEIRPNFPNEKQRKVAMSTQVKGILSEHTIMEQYLDIEQPEDEWNRKLIEMASKDPVVIRYTLLKELQRRVEEEKDQVAALVLQQMQNESIPTGQPGRPAEPNNPMQPTGLQSSTGLPVPEAVGNPPPGQSETDVINSISNNTPGYTY